MKKRDFTKGAILFTLANRPAWAQQTQCLSANTALSIAAGSSLHPGQENLEVCPEPKTLDSIFATESSSTFIGNGPLNNQEG